MTSKARRFMYLHDIGCIVCQIEGWGHEPCQIHHLVDKGTRELSGGDMATIGLCPWHHQGLCKEGLQASKMHELRGPSLRLSSAEFNERWPQRELLRVANLKIAERQTMNISRAS